ncbi:MAG: hypothetical protein E6K41_05040 [Gammaproteobacteria bacterium]|nr:MAG: hypothetical protein E6K41_05040 [Gammaproteobacteria bacterium]
MPPRPYLVFVRAGDESLHGRLIAEDGERNWDCCVSWYVPPRPERLAEYYSHGGFNKFDGFLEFWRQRPQPRAYRYLLLLDDDVYLRPGDVSRFFTLCEHYRTYLAQPALRWFTQTTLNALVRNPVCVLRRVSGVEVMAPCFSAAALEALLPTFGMTRSTWGTDLAWSGLIGGRQPIHVVDAIGMDHTRTGGGRPSAFYRKLAEMGVDPHEELRSVERLYPQLRRYRTLSSGHVFRDGLARAVAPALMWLIERLKFIVRIRKRALVHLRYWRATLTDAFTR